VWDTTLCRWASSTRRFEGSLCVCVLRPFDPEYKEIDPSKRREALARNRASYPGWPESSAIPLWEPQMPQVKNSWKNLREVWNGRNFFGTTSGLNRTDVADRQACIHFVPMLRETSEIFIGTTNKSYRELWTRYILYIASIRLIHAVQIKAEPFYSFCINSLYSERLFLYRRTACHRADDIVAALRPTTPPALQC
jgi:hypothetical protein